MDGPLQLPMAHEDDADALVWDGFWIGMGWHGIGMDHGGAGWLVSCWAWALAWGLGLVLVLVACRAGNQGFPQVDQAQGRR